MIRLLRASKTIETPRGPVVVLDEVTARLPAGRRIGIYSRPPQATSILFDLFAGAEVLDAGSIRVDAAISWPLGRRNHLFGSMTTRDAATFVARMYGQDTGRVVEFVRAFSGIGREIDRSLVRCPFDVRAKVQLALSLSIEFDYYLLDRVVLHKDPDFNARVWAALHERVEAGSSVIVATRQPRSLLKVCDMGIVLSNGDVMIYDDYREAVRAARMTAARTAAARTTDAGRPQTKSVRLEGHPA